MQVSRLNQFFGKIGQAQIRFRWAILAVFTIITFIRETESLLFGLADIPLISMNTDSFLLAVLVFNGEASRINSRRDFLVTHRRHSNSYRST